MGDKEQTQILSAIYGVLGDIYKATVEDKKQGQAKKNQDPRVATIAGKGTLSNISSFVRDVSGLSKKDARNAAYMLDILAASLPRFTEAVNKIDADALQGIYAVSVAINTLSEISIGTAIKLKVTLPMMSSSLKKFMESLDGAVIKTDEEERDSLKLVTSTLKALAEVSIWSAAKLKVFLPSIGKSLKDFMSTANSATKGQDNTQNLGAVTTMMKSLSSLAL